MNKKFSLFLVGLIFCLGLLNFRPKPTNAIQSSFISKNINGSVALAIQKEYNQVLILMNPIS